MKVEHALRLAEMGFRVFPLSPNTKKPPKGFPWKAEATTDRTAIEAWWAEDPDYNVGVAPGHGRFIVDADCKDGQPGLESLAMLDMAGLPGSLRVTTPSGGVHVYLTTAANHRNRIDVPDYPGIDIRSLDDDGHQGYVVGPGSTIDGKAYRADWKPIEQSPAWFDEALAATHHKALPRTEEWAIAPDTPENIERAIDFLVNRAPHAIEGNHGDTTTYWIAAELRALGISENKSLDLLLEHWNEQKASPPWDPDDLAAKVASAHKSGHGAPGGKTAQGEFEALDFDIGEPPRKHETSEAGIPTAFPLTKASACTGNKIPPRQWLYGYMLSRKYVTVLASPGGVGKTAYTYGLALAAASGKTLLHDRPHKPMRVWLYNLEDDMLELQRRIQAVAHHYEADQKDLDNIILTSGRDRPLLLAGMHDGAVKRGKDIETLTAALLDNSIDVLVLDPLVNAHSLPENDTEATAQFMRILASIADRANCAILLVHHTRKNFIAGDADSVRGGSSLVANSRGAYTLAPMSPEEAKAYGVPEDRRRSFIRLDDAKVNMARASGARWMAIQSVSLGNGDEDYPSGDSVQVVTEWRPPQALDGLERSDIRTMLSAIGEGPGDGERYTVRVSSGDTSRWAGTVLVERFGRSPEQAKGFLKTAEKNGWISTVEYRSPTQRKTRKGIEIHLANVPEEDIADLD